MEDAALPLPVSGSPEAVGLTRAATRRGIFDAPADAMPASTDGALPLPARVSRSQLSTVRGQSLRSHLLLPLHFMQKVHLEWRQREFSAGQEVLRNSRSDFNQAVKAAHLEIEEHNPTDDGVPTRLVWSLYKFASLAPQQMADVFDKLVHDDSRHSVPASPLAAIQSVQQWGLAISGQLQAAISDISAADSNASSSVHK